MLNKSKRNKQNCQQIGETYSLRPQLLKRQSKLRKSNVGKIIKNKSINGSNHCSRVLNQLPVYTNYTRPSSRNKQSQMKLRYEMIDDYLYQKINKLDSIQNSRTLRTKKEEGKDRQSRVQQRTLESSRHKSRIQKSIIKKQNSEQKQPTQPSYTYIIKQLKKQLNLQAKLRESKHKINRKNSQQVKQILSKKYKIQQQKYKLSTQQFDPFLIQIAECDVEQLCKQIHQGIYECENNWSRKLSKAFRKQDVQCLFKRLDFQKQNELNLNVFVREISMVLNLNLRKRDLFTIFVRLAENNMITKKSFGKVLSSK